MELYQKALACAINDIKNQVTPKAANLVYQKWEVFHKNFKFKQAIENKKMAFKKK